MLTKANCIMLVDDNSHDNFFHEREIKKVDLTNIVIKSNSGNEALKYLKSRKVPNPDLIFLDINMPGMNGWEFLEKFNNLDAKLQVRPIIIMLTTSENPDDVIRAKTFDIVSDYISKPLTKEMMQAISVKYFNTDISTGVRAVRV